MGWEFRTFLDIKYDNRIKWVLPKKDFYYYKVIRTFSHHTKCMRDIKFFNILQKTKEHHRFLFIIYYPYFIFTKINYEF